MKMDSVVILAETPRSSISYGESLSTHDEALSHYGRGFEEGVNRIPVSPLYQYPVVVPMAVEHNKVEEEKKHKKSNDWTFDMFDCCSAPGIWIKALFCPCVQYAANRTKMGTSDTQSGFMHGLMHCASLPWWCCGVPSWIGAKTRLAYEDEFNIKSNKTTNALAHCFCISCALTQESREIDWQLAQQRVDYGIESQPLKLN